METLSPYLDSVNNQNSQYSLDKDLRFRRQPGDDDGPSLTLDDPAWREKDPWDQILSILEDALPVQTSFYLDNNAQLGVGQETEAITDSSEDEDGRAEARLRTQINGEIARASLCLKTAAHFDGTTIHEDGSTSLYHHALNCRKPWCEICGGKQGVISKTRKRAIFSKFRPTDYGLRQLVLTVPMDIREKMQSRADLKRLMEDGKQVSAKYFGDSLKTKRKANGEVKEYSFGDNLAIGYLHAFGDPDKDGFYRHGDAGTFHPHVNIHIFEKSDNLSLSKETLKNIRDDWALRLRKYGDFTGEVDIHYKFVNKSTKARKKLHKIKYMVKPYLQENIQKVIQDDNLALLELLTIEMKGFQWLRFWGGLSNQKKHFRDEAGILPDNIEEIESRINDKLVFRSVTEWNLKGHLEADKERIAKGKNPKFKKQGENFYEERIGAKGD